MVSSSPAVFNIGLQVAHAGVAFHGGLQPAGGNADILIVGADEGELQPSAPARPAGVGEDPGGHSPLFGQSVPDLLVQVVGRSVAQQDVEAGPVKGSLRAGAETPAAGAQGHLVSLYGAAGYELVQYALNRADLLHQLDSGRVAAEGEVDADALGASLGEEFDGQRPDEQSGWPAPPGCWRWR